MLMNVKEPIIKYIPLQQGLRLIGDTGNEILGIIKYIPLQQGLRLQFLSRTLHISLLLSIFHYNKD